MFIVGFIVIGVLWSGLLVISSRRVGSMKTRHIRSREGSHTRKNKASIPKGFHFEDLKLFIMDY